MSKLSSISSLENLPVDPAPSTTRSADQVVNVQHWHITVAVHDPQVRGSRLAAIGEGESLADALAAAIREFTGRTEGVEKTMQSLADYLKQPSKRK